MTRTFRTRRTKIVASIGPACERPDQLRTLIDAGVDVFRVSFAHDPVERNLEKVGAVRRVADQADRFVGVLADLPGPKIRTGDCGEDGLELKSGAEVALVPGDAPCAIDRLVIDHASLHDDLEVGDRITLGDGAIALEVCARTATQLSGIVLHGGVVRGKPGVHLPSGRLRVDVPTAEDRQLLQAIGGTVDFVAVSFVRTEHDVLEVRDAVGTGGPAVIAKIETSAAIEHLDAIVRTADGVMVARGDLGAECDIAEVPHLQKRIVRQCVAFGVPVITATQVLESMTHAPSPTRAEATDIANAVFDGTDALMLSGETAIGDDPELVVRTMSDIAERAEAHADYLAWGGRLGRIQTDAHLDDTIAITAAMSHAAWRTAVELDLAAILCCTRSGLTARAMARFRPPCPVIAASPSRTTLNRLALSFGAELISVAEYRTTEEMVWCVLEEAVRRGLVTSGQRVGVLAGSPEDPTATTDVLRVVRIR